jgi:hypothetical protein
LKRLFLCKAEVIYEKFAILNRCVLILNGDFWAYRSAFAQNDVEAARDLVLKYPRLPEIMKDFV